MRGRNASEGGDRWCALSRPGPAAGSCGPGAPPSSPATSHSGFALVGALIAIVGLTALATAGFLVSDTDYRVSTNHRTSTNAFYVADAAWNQYLGTQGVPDPQQSYTFGGGSAAVRSRRLLEIGNGRTLYEVAADGTRPVAPSGASRRTARSVTLYTPLPINVPGAFTAVNGLRKNGMAGTISGDDAAPPGLCPGTTASYGNRPSIAGVAVPPNGYTQMGGGTGNNQNLVPEGDPPVADTLSSLELVEFSGLDWEGFVSEDKITPDYVIPAEAWPDYSSVPVDEWPVIHVTASSYNLAPGHSGWGTIILDGDVSMNGDFEWRGLLLAGGRLVSDGTQEIWGAMYTGLNLLTGGTVQKSEVGNGYKVFRYHSCNIESAARAMGWLSEIPGSWYEAI